MDGTSWDEATTNRSEQLRRQQDNERTNRDGARDDRTYGWNDDDGLNCDDDEEEEKDDDDEYSLQAFQHKLDQLTASLENNVNLERVVLEAKQATMTRHTPSVFFGSNAATKHYNNDDDDDYVYGSYLGNDDTDDTDEAARTLSNGRKDVFDRHYHDRSLAAATALTTPERRVSDRTLPQTDATVEPLITTTVSKNNRSTPSSFVAASVETPEPPTPVKTPLRSHLQPPLSSSLSSPYRHTRQEEVEDGDDDDKIQEDDSFLSRLQHSPVSQPTYPMTTNMGRVAPTVGGANISVTEQAHPTMRDNAATADHQYYRVRHSLPTSRTTGRVAERMSNVDPREHPVHGQPRQEFVLGRHVNQLQQTQPGFGVPPPHSVTGVAGSSHLANGPTTDPTAMPSRLAANNNNARTGFGASIPHCDTAATSGGGTMQDLIILVEGLRDTIDRQERRIRTLEDENDQWRSRYRRHSRSGDDRYYTPGGRFVHELAQVMEIPPQNVAPLSRIMDLQLHRLVLEDQRRRRSLGYR